MNLISLTKCFEFQKWTKLGQIEENDRIEKKVNIEKNHQNIEGQNWKNIQIGHWINEGNERNRQKISIYSMFFRINNFTDFFKLEVWDKNYTFRLVCW